MNYYSEALNLSVLVGQPELRHEIEVLGSLLTSSSLDYIRIQEKIRTVLVRYRDLGNAWWKFTYPQAEKLLKYFRGTELLAQSLGSACVTDRAAIEDRLLLPSAPKEPSAHT